MNQAVLADKTLIPVYIVHVCVCALCACIFSSPIVEFAMFLELFLTKGERRMN